MLQLPRKLMMKMNAPAAMRMYAPCSITEGSVNSCKIFSSGDPGCMWQTFNTRSGYKGQESEGGERKEERKTFYHLCYVRRSMLFN